MGFSSRLLSVVRPSVNFSFFFLRTIEVIRSNLAQSLTSLCKGIEVYLNEEQRLIPRGDTYNIEIPKINLEHLKNCRLQNNWAHFNQFGTNHLWVQGIQMK